MLHVFVSAADEDIRPGATGKAIPGYRAQVISRYGQPVPDGTPGQLATIGPTGCRYLADPRQATYVKNGWNITGDTYIRDADGYLWYQGRSDDIIVSSGYNIAPAEIERAIEQHPDVVECAVVGQPDADRGMIVHAAVVLRDGAAGDEAAIGGTAGLREGAHSTVQVPAVDRVCGALPGRLPGRCSGSGSGPEHPPEARPDPGAALPGLAQGRELSMAGRPAQPAGALFAPCDLDRYSPPGKRSAGGEPTGGFDECPAEAGTRLPPGRPQRPLAGRCGMTATASEADPIRVYGPDQAAAWDDLVARSVNGTILHTRRFLAYHGDRFRDRSVLIANSRGSRIVGVFPAAEDPADPSMVTSHPGLSYGGVVHDGTLRGRLMLSAFREIAAQYRALGYSRLRYKAMPWIYQPAPAADDQYALFHFGAGPVRARSGGGDQRFAPGPGVVWP